METTEKREEYTDFFRYTRLGLINYGQNEELLIKVPHRKFLDLAIVMLRAERYDPAPSECEYVTADDLMRLGISEAKAFTKAKLSGQDLGGIYFGTVVESLEYLTRQKVPFAVPDMYILSNMDFCYGAASMTYGGLLSEIYKYIGTDFYVIPSSVNELIIVKDYGGEDYADYLQNTLMAVNRLEESDEGYLSDNIYFYDHKKDALTLHFGQSVN